MERSTVHCGKLSTWLGLLFCFFAGIGCTARAPVEIETQKPRRSDESAGESSDASSGREIVAKDSLVRRLVAAEELILRLTPQLEKLALSAENLSIPDHNSESLFAPAARVTRLASLGEATTNRLGVTMVTFAPTATDPDAEVPNGVCPLLFHDIVGYESAKFSIVSGQFVDAADSYRVFETPIRFTGKARSTDGELVAITLDLLATWQRSSDGQDPDQANSSTWQITNWKNQQLHCASRAGPMFVDVRESVILDEKTLAATRTSKHSEFAMRHYYPRIRARLPGNYSDDRFFAISTAHHPGLSVVDIDRDGWDDLYVSVRWGKNLLLRNGSDGTFTDVAAEYGLDIEGRSNAAVFGDFDNDGDSDLIVARSLERSLYLENVGGHFEPRPNSSRFPLPYAATSVSAVDYNNDGLLDVYFSTYHQEDVSQRIDADLAHAEHRIHTTLSKEHSKELARRFRAESRSYINQIGPPNILLVNRGDFFELAPENDQVAVWRNSFQATWCDYDQDGDADVYVANDFSPDVLLRNDRGSDGTNGFTNVTADSGFETLGFGMGADWGDFDGDGQFDLYVSNMYSKAGKRITGCVSGEANLDRRISDLARGNYLHRLTDGRFQLVSDTGPAAAVARAGWSWGGQFADYDNDGNLDLYVASGYYSVPREFETDVDL